MNRTSLLATSTIIALVTTGPSMAQQEHGASTPTEKMAPSGARPPSAVKQQNGEAQSTPAGRHEKLDGRVGETPPGRGHTETTGQAPREDQLNERASEPRRSETEQGPRSERNGQAPVTGQAPREDRRRATEDNPGTAGQGAAGTRANINITPEKRTRIHETLIRERNAPHVSSVNFDVAVGARVPRSVRFVALPQTIVEIEPAWRSFEYFVIGDEIVVVNPRSMEIVAIVDA